MSISLAGNSLSKVDRTLIHEEVFLGLELVLHISLYLSDKLLLYSRPTVIYFFSLSALLWDVAFSFQSLIL